MVSPVEDSLNREEIDCFLSCMRYHCPACVARDMTHEGVDQVIPCSSSATRYEAILRLAVHPFLRNIHPSQAQSFARVKNSKGGKISLGCS